MLIATLFPCNCLEIPLTLSLSFSFSHWVNSMAYPFPVYNRMFTLYLCMEWERVNVCVCVPTTLFDIYGDLLFIICCLLAYFYVFKSYIVVYHLVFIGIYVQYIFEMTLSTIMHIRATVRTPVLRQDVPDQTRPSLSGNVCESVWKQKQELSNAIGSHFMLTFVLYGITGPNVNAHTWMNGSLFMYVTVSQCMGMGYHTSVFVYLFY